MASPLEMLHLGQELDIPGQMQKADIGYQQYQVQKAGLEQQQKEIAGEQNAPTGLDKQANLAVPKTWTLDSPDGMLTPGGEINRLLVDGKKNQADGMKMLKEAKYATNPQEKEKLIDAGRRLFDEGGRLQKEGHEATKKTVGGLFYGLGTAGSKDDWDNTLKSYQDSGIPLPEGFPKEYSPENKRKVRAIAAAKDPETAKKIDAENRAVEDQQMQRDAAKRKAIKESASDREDGLGGKEYKDVKGQLEGLKNYIPTSEIKKLGAKEVVAVSTKLEAAELTDELATLVQQNPQAAGLVGSFYKNFDKFLPERYDSQDASAATDIINREADKLEKSGVPKDEVTQARLIAKKAVDVINARALAASGGGRVLVSELRLQKDVLGLEGLSPTSAVGVYRGLAESDRKATKRYGINTDTIKRTQAPAEKSAEAKPSEAKLSIPKAPEGVPAGAQYSPSQKKWWWKKPDGTWESK